MALDFPASPTNGQLDPSGQWIYNSSKLAWQSVPLTQGKTVTSPTPPSSPQNGDQWFNTNDGTLYIYYTDANTSQWVESRAPITADGYQSPNYIINGGFDIWQRGTSITMTGSVSSYTADRWYGYQANSLGTVSRVAGTGSRYAAKVQRNAGSTTTNWVYLSHSIDTDNSVLLAGKTVTLSFYAKAGANFSAAALNFSWYSGTGTDQNFIHAITGQVALASSNIALTQTLQRYTFTATMPANSTQTGFWFGLLPTGTAGADDSFTVERVQLEEGSVATLFRRNANSIQGELAACQRYYWRRYSENPYGVFAWGTSISATVCLYPIQFPATMRRIPDIDISAASTFRNWGALTANSTMTGLSILSASAGQADPNTNSVMLQSTGGSSMTSNNPYALTANNNTSAFIGFSAEL